MDDDMIYLDKDLTPEIRRLRNRRNFFRKKVKKQENEIRKLKNNQSRYAEQLSMRQSKKSRIEQKLAEEQAKLDDALKGHFKKAS